MSKSYILKFSACFSAFSIGRGGTPELFGGIFTAKFHRRFGFSNRYGFKNRKKVFLISDYFLPVFLHLFFCLLR